MYYQRVIKLLIFQLFRGGFLKVFSFYGFYCIVLNYNIVKIDFQSHLIKSLMFWLFEF